MVVEKVELYRRVTAYFLALFSLLINGLSLYLQFNNDFLAVTDDASHITILWLISLIYLGLAVTVWPKHKINQPTEKKMPIPMWIWLFCTGLLLVGLILRIYKIDNRGLALDEWYWIENARGILSGVIRTPFGFIGDQPSNMPAYVVAAFYALIHNGYLAVRLPGVFYSLSTAVFGFAFLSLAYDRKSAFMFLLVLITSIWDIHMAQGGRNNVNISPFLITGTIYFTYRSINNLSVKDAFWGGLFLGISINLLYIAALTAVFAFFAWLGGFIRSQYRESLVWPFAVFCLTVFMVISPTLIKVVRYPERSTGRHLTFIQQNENLAQQKGKGDFGFYYVDQVKEVGADFIYHPAKYSYGTLWGVTIEPFVLMMFAVGSMYLIWNIRRFVNRLLLIDGVVMLIPVVVLFRTTSVWREYGLLPVIYLFTGLGMWCVARLVSLVLIKTGLRKPFALRVGAIIVASWYLVQWSGYYRHYDQLVQQQEPVEYETVCKRTASYIRANISSQTQLFLPDEVCSKLMLGALDDQYSYAYYTRVDNLDSVLVNYPGSVIIGYSDTSFEGDSVLPYQIDKKDLLPIKQISQVIGGPKVTIYRLAPPVR